MEVRAIYKFRLVRLLVRRGRGRGRMEVDPPGARLGSTPDIQQPRVSCKKTLWTKSQRKMLARKAGGGPARQRGRTGHAKNPICCRGWGRRRTAAGGRLRDFFPVECRTVAGAGCPSIKLRNWGPLDSEQNRWPSGNPYEKNHRARTKRGSKRRWGGTARRGRERREKRKNEKRGGRVLFHVNFPLGGAGKTGKCSEGQMAFRSFPSVKKAPARPEEWGGPAGAGGTPT